MITLATTTARTRARTIDIIATALVASVVVSASALGPTDTGRATGVTAVLVLGAIAAFVDARTGRIPDRLVALAAVGVTVAIVATAFVEGPVPVVGGAVLGALLLAGPLLACHVVAPASIGFGDVKLAIVAGAAVGMLDPRLALVASCVATGTTAAVGVVRRRSELPLGPGLVLGAAVAVLASRWVFA